MSDVVRFIRRNGRVIPIHAAGGSVRAHKVGTIVARGTIAGAGAVAIAKHGSIKPKNAAIKVNRGLDLLGLGLSVAGGVIGAATFTSGVKGFIGGTAASYGLDVAGISANVASVAGKGHLKERVIQGEKQEVRNFAVGNAIFLGGLVGIKKNRQEIAGIAKKGIHYAAKILSFARKGLRVV